MTDFAAIILAAGKGTRMKSALHKVLHPIAGKPMLLHLLDSFDELAPQRTVVVVGDRREQIDAALHNGLLVQLHVQLQSLRKLPADGQHRVQ